MSQSNSNCQLKTSPCDVLLVVVTLLAVQSSIYACNMQL